MGLTLNVKKTECMVISKKAIVPLCNLQSRGQQIKLVKKFKYLGYMITSDGKCITEIKKRIATAKDAFQKLSLTLKNRNISMTTKFRVLKTYVWSTLTYGCECWTITSDIEKKIEAAEMWFIRRMLRISWAEKKRSEYMSRIPRHVSSRVYVSHSETCKQPSVDLVHISECEIHGGR